MVSKEIYCKILEKKLRKYPKWLQDGLREDLMADFKKFNAMVESEIYEMWGLSSVKKVIFNLAKMGKNFWRVSVIVEVRQKS